MELFTIIGWALLLWGAYKVGVYVERKMKQRQQALHADADSDPDSDAKRNGPRSP